jgi:phospholipid/cholesterol/gamma-HCH transport system permease protein
MRLPALLHPARDILGLGAEVVRSLARRPPSRARVVAQMHVIGNGSILFISVVLAFLGMILVYQGIIPAGKILPDYTMAGATLINVMVREFGPTITALMIATRVGSGIAAELGSMTVTDQVEAMKVTNCDPVVYLVAPRFLASIVMTLALTVWGVLIAVLAGMVMAWSRFQINPGTFLSLRMMEWQDVWEGLIKCVAYGAAIPIIAAESGFRASGGSEGVGWATTRSVVNTSFAVIFLDFAIASGVYLVTG